MEACVFFPSPGPGAIVAVLVEVTISACFQRGSLQHPWVLTKGAAGCFILSRLGLVQEVVYDGSAPVS